MEHKAKILLSIDGKELSVEEDLTILEAAKQNDIYIPTLCHHPALSNWGGCRICMVEVDGSPKLVASCVMPVRAGMEVVTFNERILESRRTALEFLFAERNHNCMFCPQSGDCELQKLAYELQMDHLSPPPTFREFPVDITSEYMGIDHNRCILCGRCVRACAEIAGNYVMNFQNRGFRNLITLDLNVTREGSTCHGCGPCMQVCPTGAIYNRYRAHYAVKGHCTDWQSIQSICPKCGLMCPTISYLDNNSLFKVEGELLDGNGAPDRGQLCYKGRFEVFKSIGKRLLHPMVRKEDGIWVEENWGNALDIVGKRLSAIRDENGGESIFGLASSAVSNEELIFFRDLMVRGWSAGHIDTLDGAHFRTISKAWGNKEAVLKEASWKMIPEADFIMITGGNPYQTQPVILSLLRRDAQEKGAVIAVVGQMDLMMPFTPYYFPVKIGIQSLLLKAILVEARAYDNKKSKQAEKLDVSDVLEASGLNKTYRRSFYEVVEALKNSENPLFIAGPGITGLNDPSVLSDVMNLALLKGLLPEDMLRLIILKPYGNSAGAWKFVPDLKSNSNSKEHRKGGIVLLGGGEALDKAVLSDMDGMDFLAVISPYFPEPLAGKADIFLPKPLWLEEDGTYTSLDGGENIYKKKVLNRPSGIQDSWQILSLLAERIGFHSEFETWSDLSKAAGS